MTVDAKREGAILYPADMRVRLRHEPRGYLYELRPTADGDFYEVLRIDTVIGSSTSAGTIRRNGNKLTPLSARTVAGDDALRMVARAWARLPFLKPKP